MQEEPLALVDPLQAMRVRPPDRVLDGHVVMPPKGGHHHGPWQNAGCAEGAAVAALDRPVACERPERASLLCPARPGACPLLPLAARAGAARGRGARCVR